MMKQPNKFSSTDSQNEREKKFRLEKEKILNDMKALEERKKVRKAEIMRKERPLTKAIVENFSPIEEKVKRIPKIPTKSFDEIMREAGEKEKMKKRHHSPQPQISAKKPKIFTNNQSENTINIPLRSINSMKKITKTPQIVTAKSPDPRKHSKYIESKTMGQNSKQERPSKTDKIIPKSVFRNISGSESNRKCGIMAQSGSMNHRINSSLNNDSIKLKEKMRPSSSIGGVERGDRSMKGLGSQTGISHHNNRPISSQNGFNSEKKRGISSQNAIKSQDNRGISSQNGIKSQDNRGISSQNGIKSRDNRGISSQNGIKSHGNPGISSKNMPNSHNDRGISSQNGINSHNGRGISSQNGISSHNGRGIASQNGRGIASQNGIKHQNSRGIQSQSGISSQNSRGILAQSGGRMAYSPSCSEDDDDRYSVDSFIDDTGGEVDEKMRQEIYSSLKFDPSKYEKVSQHDDCRFMVSSSRQIREEEAKSARIAKEEDLKEARLEEERLKRKGKL